MSVPFHHALKVRENICQSCTHCMKKCPTEAIRIDKGHAHVDSSRCIDCGQCMKVCPHHAIGVEQTPSEVMFSFKYRVAVVPAVFFAQFEDDISESQIFMALFDIGFTHICLAELGVDISDLLKLNDKAEKPIISTFCSSVNRLIRIKYPSLVKHLDTIKSPCQLAAIFARADLKQGGLPGPDIGIFYITPCPSKISQIKTEDEATPGLDEFDGVLNLDTVYNMVSNSLAKNRKKFASLRLDENAPIAMCSSSAIKWALAGGENATKTGRCMTIDEIHHVSEFLEYMEEAEEENLNIDYLEFKACAEGCVGGILTPRNRFLAAERLNHWATSLSQEITDQLKERIENLSSHIKENAFEIEEELEPIVLDADLATAIHKMEKVRRIVEALPGIDCGLCGAPSCRALAEDIAQTEASIRQCTVLRLKDPKELNTLSRIWGGKIQK